MTNPKVEIPLNDASEPIVVTTVEDRVMTIRMNRPERLNGLGRSMRVAVSDALHAADEDDEVRCVILTGTGRAFSSGADLTESGMGPSTGRVYDWFRFHDDGAYGDDAKMDLRSFRKPVVCAVNGLCYGAALIVTTGADITVAKESARFALIEARMGNSGASTLPFLMTPQWAKFMMFTGEIITAARAKEIGLILEVFPDDIFDEKIVKLGSRIAAMPAVSTMLQKRQINGTVDMMGWVANETFTRSHGGVLDAMSEYAEAPDGRPLREIMAKEGFKAFKEARDAAHEEPWLLG